MALTFTLMFYGSNVAQKMPIKSTWMENSPGSPSQSQIVAKRSLPSCLILRKHYHKPSH